jgi:class 3 adenylate cyclase
MEGWHEIELARNSHAKQEYSQASKHYEKAAQFHNATKQWNYLAPNYSAWASVEIAEDFSRREDSQEAIQSFQDAIERFAVARGTLLAESSKAQGAEEKQMISKLAKATEIRRDYCKARIALEEGRILDRRGDHSSSSEKYGEAAGTLEKMTHDLESDERRRDIQLVMTLSNAWKIMAQAEAEASSQLYLKASRLFEEAKDLNTSEKGKMLSLGHSRFCLALEAGTRFADMRDPALHDSAIQSLASAANYYLKAGSKSSSEYSKATGLLYDAYLRLDRAKKEEDQEKRTKIYAMVEKLLRASAEAYARAGYHGKEDEVQRLRDNVKADRKLSRSLAEVLHAPPTLSSPEAFDMPNPTFEKAVGLERFENADVQANLISPRKLLQVGETVDIEIELVNAGRGVAQLIKIEDIKLPGFDVTSGTQSYRVEDNYLNMKGRRLEPLKTEEVKLVLRPNAQGRFTLRPRILYLDQGGNYKSHETEPMEVTVDGLRSEYERRLSAIMFTDVVGYTSLSGKNESLALELLEEHRRLLRLFFPIHQGKEVKTVGDMFLVEFGSALEAVRCAVQIQEALSKRNLRCPEENRINVRIGLHVGDVEHSQGDVYGDAVNIASRIEPLAEPGGIVITRQVYEQVRNRPDIKMLALGRHELKNVNEPLELFRVLL